MIASLLAGVLVAAALMWLASDRAWATDVTDDKVSHAEARYTYVGEFRRDIVARIGPVTHLRVGDRPNRRAVDYRTYRPHYTWEAHYALTDDGWAYRWGAWVHCPDVCDVAAVV